MVSPTDVAAFHADYDRHPGDRVRLFAAVAAAIPTAAAVLYPGSYVDLAPSVWFDDVTYVDMDKRAARFFAQTDDVAALIARERRSAGRPATPEPRFAFHHLDYRSDLPVADRSVDLLVSLYAGFISEHATRHLRTGGHLLANDSHGDASMATLDPRFELAGVVLSAEGDYRVATDGLDPYLEPKRGAPPTVEQLHETNRGIAYTRPGFAYLFRLTSAEPPTRPTAP